MLEFDAASHTYRLDGQRIVSVTTILDRYMDFDGIPLGALEGARIRGQFVHEACNLLVRDELAWDSLDPQLAPYIRGAQRFLDESGLVVIGSEERVYSKTLRVAGTLDLRGEMRRQRWLLDWKATSQFPITVGPQTAAYDRLYRDMHGGREHRRACVLLKPDDYKLFVLDDRRDLNTFISAVNCYNYFWSKQDARKKAA